jgi:hypothetical protein
MRKIFGACDISPLADATMFHLMPGHHFPEEN